MHGFRFWKQIESFALRNVRKCFAECWVSLEFVCTGSALRALVVSVGIHTVDHSH